MRHVACLLTTLLLGLAAPAHAQEAPSADLAEEADLHFRIAVERYRAGDFEGALEHLLVSNRLVPNKNVVFNIARTYEQLRRYDQAFRHYADYLDLEDDPAERSAAEQAIERIRGQVALVRVESDPPGATIYVDRKDLGPRGTTPRTLALRPGERVIVLEMGGHEGAEATATATVGSTTTVTAALEPILGRVSVVGSPEGATIRLGSESGEVLGTVPTTLALPPGAQVLSIEAPSYRAVQRVATVEADGLAEVVVELPLRTGTVVVDALERDALIEIDGEPAGFTPAVLDVPVGEHAIRVSRTGFRTYEGTVEIVEGEKTLVDVRLRSQQEVTAATRTRRTVEEAPASVSIVTGDEIRAFGYQSVHDALGGVRGIYQTSDLSYEYLGFRGFSRAGDYGNRTLVTIDGHAMNDDLLGASYVGTDLTSDLHDVQRIEVVRGPGSALYGTNAFFGVINVVTPDGSAVPAPHAAITADGARTGRARVGGGFGDADAGAWVGLAAHYRQGDDYWFPEWDAPGEGDGRSVGADRSVGGNVQAKAWAGDFTFEVYFNGRKKRIPTGAFETLLGDPRATTSDLRSFAEVRWEPSFGERVRLYARAWTDSYEYFGSYPYDANLVTKDRWSGAWSGVEPRIVASPTDWLEITAGAEARFYWRAKLFSFDLIDGDEQRFLDERPIQQVYAGYALAEARPVESLRLSVGARYDHFTLEDTGGAFSPRAAVIWTPSDRDTLKLVGGTAFRAPSAYEWLYNDDGLTQIPAGDLDPEGIVTGEIEITHRFDEVTFLTFASYYDRITDLVDAELTGIAGEEGELFWYSNTDEPVQTGGVEIEVRREWRGGAMAGVQYSLQHTRRGSLFEGEPIVNSPPHLASLKLAAPVVPGVTTVATRVRLESPRLRTDGEQTDWGLLWDVILTGEVPRAPVRFGVGVRNLLDWKVEHPTGVDVRMPAVPQAGRTLFATIEARLPEPASP